MVEQAEFTAEIDTPPEYVKRVERKKSIRENKEAKFLASAKKIFDEADTDKSGVLTMDQARILAQGMHKEHGTEFNEEEFQAYFKETDLNNDGVLQWDEWYAKAFQ